MRILIFCLSLMLTSICHASMVWSAVAVEPSLLPRLRSDEKLLESTIFEAPEASSVYLDKAWHGIHYLLTGSAEPNGSLASKVIMGGESIGPDLGYGEAQLLTPKEVQAIAKLLKSKTPEALASRYQPSALARAGIYPEVIWEREKEGALNYVLEYYKKLVAFYGKAAENGSAVILSLH